MIEHERTLSFPGRILAKPQPKELILSGVKLKTLVSAAEAPMTGDLIKRQLFADLELDDLMAFDLRETDPPIATLPVHPPEEV